MTPDQQKGQGGSCETVRIKAESARGFAIINAEDFDPKAHKKYEEPRAAAEKEEAKKK
jgi:hypothetical protein